MTVGSLFSGIGGLDLGLERAGMEIRWQVEIDEFCRKVLAKHWPNVKRYGDIKELSGDELERVDLICGGFPCQGLSVAGKRAGIDGEQSGLWAHYARLLGVVRPRFVLIENVAGLLANEPMRRVLGDLSSLGFHAEWEMLPARALGAPHARERVFVFAYTNGQRCDNAPERYTTIPVFGGSLPSAMWPWCSEPPLLRSHDGISDALDRLCALGNAVVPQVAEWIGRRIVEAERERNGG